MDRYEVRRLEVVETGRRRIVEESLVPGMSASVARRHGISPSHPFLWRKAHRDGGLSGTWPAFAPVTVGAPGWGPPDGRMEVVAAKRPPGLRGW